MEPDYTYNAKVVSVYDGDTIRADIDLGFGIFIKNQSLRLLGINTPEVRGKERGEGLIVRDHLRDLIENQDILVQVVKGRKGKYGRWLATIFLKTDGGEVININEYLLDANMAEEYLK